jgi:hypothetical protein
VLSARRLSLITILCLIIIVSCSLFLSETNYVARAAGQAVTFNLQVSATETPQNAPPLTLTGTLSAAVSGKVVLQWSVNGSGFLYNYDMNMTNGMAQREFGFGGTGNWTFRMLWNGNTDFKMATSNVVSVNVLPAQNELDSEPDYTPYIIAVVVVAVVIVGFLAFSKNRNKKKQAKGTPMQQSAAVAPA